MANYTVSVYDAKHENEICVDFTPNSKISISINGDSTGLNPNSGLILLDISSAIKFSKELRRQIANAKELSDLKSNSNG